MIWIWLGILSFAVAVGLFVGWWARTIGKL